MMDEQTTDAAPPAPDARGMRKSNGRRAWVRSAAWVGGGLVAGGILAGTVTAAAADDQPGTAPTGSYGYGAPADGERDGDGPGGRHDGPGGRHHGDGPGAGEEALTGDTAASVKAAVVKKYPDATIERLETDSDGVYEAHVTTADGDRVTVELDKDFTVTGTE
jgi:hypothetical protein